MENNNNKIPYFYNEEDLYDFFAAQSQTTQEYFNDFRAKKEDILFENKMNKNVGITE